MRNLSLRRSNQYYDAESGLHYHRYLYPRNGRYLSADPIGIAGGLNLYAFAENNPLANIDPLGLQAKPAGDISSWDTQRRAQYLFLRTGSQVPGVIGDILRELVSPASLATTAAVFTVWAGAQFTPVGPAVDAAIVIAGYFIAGTGAVIAAKEILKAAILIDGAKCEADLQKAADLLAIGMVDALGATAGLAGSAKAMRSERVQGVLRRVFKNQGNVEKGAFTGAGSAADALRLRTKLKFQEAGILNAEGTLTQKAIQDSKIIPLSDGVIRNPNIVSTLTRDRSKIEDWAKFTTNSVVMPNGQMLQIHFYKNTKTLAVDYLTQDFKVKGIVKP